jgi:hypothetical protein
MDDAERMFDLADRLKHLKDSKKELEQSVKDVNAKIEEVDSLLASAMLESETQNFTKSGSMFCLTNTVRASAAADGKEALFDALREEGYGDLIYETVNANSLSAFVREQMLENNDQLPEWLSGMINLFEKTTVSVRKAANK